MSELGIGPDQVNRNADGRVTAVFLQGRDISDEQLVNLVSFEFLTGLMLNDTQITDSCIEHLLALSHLNTIWIVGTKITPAGVARIKRAKPQALVFSKPGQGAYAAPGGQLTLFGPP